MFKKRPWVRHDLVRRSITPPTRKEKLTLRTLILLGLSAMGLFVYWFARPEHIGYLPLYIMLSLALGFKLLRLLHEWYHYWDMSVPEPSDNIPELSVDMLTTYVKGEPYDMIEESLQAMVAVTYPHVTYLCDEANDPHLKAFCEEIGVHHVYRGEDKSDAKAGNINYALREYAKGEITIILDPDHVPEPDFIERVLPYFADPKVGYVQSVQTYGNQQESFVAKAAAEQTYHFYGPMMMSMNSYGTVQAIGANCAFRRQALDEIGGHAPGLSEDMHTAMRIHAKGWKSCYVPDQTTRGRVPSNLPAYYKQQIKWSRGTFELLFRVYPKLFGQFSWRQRLHYFLLPFHFLSGLITLLDILVPILSLFLALVPWTMDLVKLGQMVTPLLLMMILIRQFAQRWVLEEQERGFHFLGGVLWAGSWWYTLMGFVYALFRVKVPYIPTPKEDELVDAWKLSLPNILAISLSIVAIIAGLRLDWNPYSFTMAGFALINILILGLAVLIGQQKTMEGLYQSIRLQGPITAIRSFWWNLRHYFLYRLIRNGSFVLLGITLAFWGAYGFISHQELQRIRAKVLSEEEPQAYFYGSSSSNQKGPSFNRIQLFWPNLLPGEGDSLSYRKLKSVSSIPLIEWLPVVEDSISKQFLLYRISSGYYDAYLTRFGEQLRTLQRPVWISFAPEPEKAENAWSASWGHCPEDYQQAWEYVVGFLSRQGVGNAVWVFETHSSQHLKPYLARTHFVHWMAYSLKGDWDAYSGFRDSLRQIKGFERKPVLLRLEKDQKPDWHRLAEHFPEVRALESSGELSEPGIEIKQFFQRPPAHFQNRISSSTSYQSPFFEKVANQWQWKVEDTPFYVKGIAYNATHDWRDGFLPLTRAQLEKDFRRIRAMGANSIRRFDAGLYDYNILNIAREQELKVMYGIWLDPEIDYLADSVKVKALRGEILHRVEEFKDHEALLAWGLGNETWNSLKYHFRMPYLAEVRMAFLRFTDQLAQDIHALDRGHPVVLPLEHSDHLVVALRDIRQLAPSIDLIGINSYAGERLESLSSLCERWIPNQPYVLTSFGPRKYWDRSSPEFTSDNYLPEVTSFAKAKVYPQAWENHILPDSLHNLGGFAYCWSDRLEGAATWFGITDYKGRLKPAYYALQASWLGQEQHLPLANVILRPPDVGPTNTYAAAFMPISPNNLREDLEYEWLLLREDIHQETGKITPIKKSFGVKVELPDRTGSYRLYVYISDQAGNVVTASNRILFGYEK